MMRSRTHRHAALIVACLACLSTISFASPPIDLLPEAGELVEAQDGTFHYEIPKLTDEQVHEIPLDVLSRWIMDQSRQGSQKESNARQRKASQEQQKQKQVERKGLVSFCGSVTITRNRSDALSDTQWEIVADRIHSALVDPDLSTVRSASEMLFQISQFLRGDQADHVMGIIYRDGQLLKLINQLDHDDIQTRVSRLSMAGASFYTIPPMSTDECFEFFDHLEKSLYVLKQSVWIEATPIELREARSYVTILRNWIYREHRPTEGDEEFARRAIRLSDLLPPDNQQGRAIKLLLAQTYGAPEIVMEYATELGARPDTQSKSDALHITSYQVSYYENKDTASRAVAMPYAISLLRELAKRPLIDEMSQGMLMKVAGSGRYLGPEAVQLLDVYLDLLEIDDQYIRPSALSSLRALGAAAHPALSRLKELAEQGGMHELSIRETIYYISQEGEKPSSYDRIIEYKAKAMKEAGCFNTDPIQSTP